MCIGGGGENLSLREHIFRTLNILFYGIVSIFSGTFSDLEGPLCSNTLVSVSHHLMVALRPILSTGFSPSRQSSDHAHPNFQNIRLQLFRRESQPKRCTQVPILVVDGLLLIVNFNDLFFSKTQRWWERTVTYTCIPIFTGPLE